MLVIVVDFRIHAAHIADFEVAMLANAHTSRTQEPGCRQFDVCRDAADPTRFFLYELYDDDAAFDEHLASDHFKQFDRLVAPWIASKAVQRLRRQAG